MDPVTVLGFSSDCAWRLARNRSAEARVRLLRVVLAGLVILPAVWPCPRWSLISGIRSLTVTISLDSEIQSMLSAASASLKTQPIDIALHLRRTWCSLGFDSQLRSRCHDSAPFVATRDVLGMEAEMTSWMADTVGVKAAVEARLSDIPSPMAYGGLPADVPSYRGFRDWPKIIVGWLFFTSRLT